MPYSLRTVNRRRWDKDGFDEFAWLNAGDLPADTLIDLQARDNVLSVWLIDDSQTNL